jgi:O-antigen/teichoic acid export membrane protein
MGVAPNFPSEIPEDEAELMSQAATAPLSRSLLFDTMPDLVRRATRRGFWPMVDQAVVSIGNFLTVIFVARGLADKTDYGAFGVILEFMFFMNNLQSGLITFPLTVKGAVEDEQGLRRLTMASSLLTLALGLPVIIITLVIGGAIGKFALGTSAAIALVIWQLKETSRRGLWAHFRHKESILGDAISYLGQALGIWMLMRTGNLTLVTVFGVMTLTNMLASIVQTAQLGFATVPLRELPQIMREFWKTGRWVALTTLSSIAGSVCGSWALWLIHGGSQVADFFAIGNLLKLCNPILSSIGGLITPAAAQRLAQAGIHAAKRTSIKYALLGAAMLGPYLLFILIFPSYVMKLTYGSDTHFLGQENALRGCAIGYMFIFTIGAMTAFLNGVHKGRYSFYGQLSTSILQFVTVLPLNILFGLNGYVWGGVLLASIQFIILGWYMHKAMKEPAEAETIEPSGFEPITSSAS